MASLAFAAPARFGRDSEAGVDGASPLGGSFAPVAGAGAVAEAGSGAAGAVAEAGGDTGGAGAVAEVGGTPDCIARDADTERSAVAPRRNSATIRPSHKLGDVTSLLSVQVRPRLNIKA